MDFKGFNLNLLVAFDALLSERSVSRAARRLNLSQPAMSTALKQLRDATGDPLFVRKAAGLTPTPRALDLAHPLLRALREVSSALDATGDFEPLTVQATFRLGMSDHPAHWLLPALAAHLAKAAPHVELRVHRFQDRQGAVRLVDEGLVDAAIGVAIEGGARIPSIALAEEQFVAIARKGGSSALALDDVARFAKANHVLISPEGDEWGVVDEALDRIGLGRRLAIVLPHMYAAPSIVAQTDYVAVVMAGVVNASGLADRLEVRLPPVPIAPIATHLFWHRRNEELVAQRWLRDQIVLVSSRLSCTAGDRSGIA